MAALRAHRRGGPEQLIVEQAPIPQPGEGEVLVAVHAAGITFDELTWDLSWTRRDGSDRTPVIPSHEFSGVVVGLGVGVEEPAVGREVFGLVPFDRDGAAAEFVVVPALAVALKPRSLDHVESAALPLAALTAWQALVDHAGLKAGERVLVQGGAGGVGLLAVELAASMGASVAATVQSGEHVALVRSRGASEVVDVARVRFEDVIGGVDVVVDTVGGATTSRSFAVLGPGGRLITLSAPPDQRRADAAGVRAEFFVVSPDAPELNELARRVDHGGLHPTISQTYPLADGRAAYESRSRPRPPGKTVLRIRDSAVI
jgi:NADPH:quinone reductase-like Zn-dependent oxidoreductase